MFVDFFDPTVIFAGSFGVFSMVILALLGLLFAVAAYVFPCYTLMTIGRKARQQDDWMAYVPFAQDIYRLRIVGAPMWQPPRSPFTATSSTTRRCCAAWSAEACA
jgi:hypothetical protein